MKSIAAAAAIALFGATFLLADAADMSGTWRLNVKRSKWGEKARPASVDLNIEHHEPKLKYSGTVTNAKDITTKFEFDGAIDGKEYTLKEDDAERKIKITRVSPNLISSDIASGDGKSTESTTTMVTKDGALIRRIQYKGPDGKRVRWTEVYEKVK